VVAALRESGHTVRALVRGAAPEGVEVFKADLCGSDDLRGAFEGIDAVMHLAAQLSGNDDERIRAAVTGTQRLLDAMAATPTRRLILASSFAVYDWSRVNGTLTEDSPLETEAGARQRDGYAVAKLQQEQLTRRSAEQHRWDLTVIRPGAIWGAGRMELHDLGQRVGPLRVVIAPCARLRLTYVENCAEAFVRALESPQSIGKTINLVDGGEPVTSWRFAGKLSGLRIPLPYWVGNTFATVAGGIDSAVFRHRLPLPGILRRRSYRARFKSVDYPNDAARRLLSWQPRYSFDEAFERATRREALRSEICDLRSEI